MHCTVMMLHPGANVSTRFGSASLPNIKIQYTKHMCPFKRPKHCSCADAVLACPITHTSGEKLSASSSQAKTFVCSQKRTALPEQCRGKTKDLNMMHALEVETL